MNEHIVKEYEAFQKSAALLDFSGHCRFEISGNDRVSFLHNILTQDIKNIKPGESARSCLLNAQGKILADMEVYVFEDKIILDAEAILEKKIPEILEKYLITEDAAIKNVSNELAHLAVEGPLSGDFKMDIPGVFPKAFTGKTGFHFLLPEKETASLITGFLKKGLQPAGMQSFEAARIAAGYLRYGIDMDETVTLPETGLDAAAASETKGCYPGQEVVARTNTYKGHQKKIAQFLLEGESAPQHGEKIYDRAGNEAGWITSAAVLPGTRKIAALGYLKKGFFENPEETKLYLKTKQILQQKPLQDDKP